MSEEYFQALRASRTGQFIYDISRVYLDFHYKVDRMVGCHTHDPSAIAYLLDPTLFTLERGPIRVIGEGLARGQTLMDRRGNWSHPTEWSDHRSVNVCVDVDSERLLALYQECILK